MKRFFTTILLVFVALITFAQDIPVGMRMEIVEAEQDNNEYSIFTYKDEDNVYGFYLSLGRVFRILDILNDSRLGDTSFDHIQETCIWLGVTIDEAFTTLETILDLFDKDVDTTAEFYGRVATGSERLGKPNSSTCIVKKKLLGGKRLVFLFDSGKHTAEAYLYKSVVKELRAGLKIEKKLHPNKYK